MDVNALSRHYLLSREFLEHGVIAATTLRTRDGKDFNMSVSHAASKEHYLANICTWLQDFELVNLYRRNRVVFLRLVHGDSVVCVDEAFVRKHSSEQFVPACDGLVTPLHGTDRVTLTVKTADCVPVFLFDCHTRASGLVHAGWRGLHRGIVGQAITTMTTALGVSVRDLLIHIGPCIRVRRYPVGSEVAALFPGTVYEADGSYFLDLASAVRQRAHAAGIRAEHISDGGYCTYDRPDLFFSARRDGLHGTMLSFITVP